MNEHKKLYLIIKDFQTQAGLTTEALADAARIPELILHECISEESKLTIGTFASLALGFLKVINASNQPALRQTYAQFVEEYVTSNPEQFDNFPNPHFKKTILRIGEETQQDAVNQKIRARIVPEEELPNERFTEQLMQYWKALNPGGQQEAVKHLYHLTFVPEYQR